jgi:hypothetical protein
MAGGLSMPARVEPSEVQASLGAARSAPIFDLEREVPKIRALAARRWQDAQARLAAGPAQRVAQREEVDAFWDWALVGELDPDTSDAGSTSPS